MKARIKEKDDEINRMKNMIKMNDYFYVTNDILQKQKLYTRYQRY